MALYKGLVVGGPLDGSWLEHYYHLFEANECDASTRVYEAGTDVAATASYKKWLYEHYELVDGVALWIVSGGSLRDVFEKLIVNYRPKVK